MPGNARRADPLSGAAGGPESVSAVAGKTSQASRVTQHDPSLRHVARDDRSRSDHGHAADPDARQHHRPASDGRAVFDDALADHPVLVPLGRAVGVDGAGMLVVEQHHARAEEDAVLKVESVEDENAVLKLAVRADPHVLVDVGALADDASLADDSTLAHLRLVPDPRALTDGGVRRDFGGGMDEDGIAHDGGSYGCSVGVCWPA